MRVDDPELDDATLPVVQDHHDHRFITRPRTLSFENIITCLLMSAMFHVRAHIIPTHKNATANTFRWQLVWRR
jgi:hypothetical protein